jgi:cytochrome c553
MERTLLVAAVLAFFGLAVAAQAAGDREAGQTKSSTCVACHGADGLGKDLGTQKVPALAGKDPAYLVQQLQAFKTGARQNPMMNMMIKPLSEQDLADLAAYYASLKAK